MPKKLNEIDLQKIKRAFLNGEGTLTDLAKRYGVSERKVKQLSSDENWLALKGARQSIVGKAIAAAQPEETRHSVKLEGGFDCDGILEAAIADLSAEMGDARIKSKEGAASAIAKLIETYRKYHPYTMDEIIDLAMNTPGFTPQEFAKRLRERFGKPA